MPQMTQEGRGGGDLLVLLDTPLLLLIVLFIKRVNGLFSLQDDLLLFPLALLVPLLDLFPLFLSPRLDSGRVGLGDLGSGELRGGEDGRVGVPAVAIAHTHTHAGGLLTLRSGVRLRRVRSSSVWDGLDGVKILTGE